MKTEFDNYTKQTTETDCSHIEHEYKNERVIENALELHSMTYKDRFRYNWNLEREKMKELTFWRKIQYFFSYHAWKILIFLIILALIALIIHQIYIATRPVALNIVLVNNTTSTVFEEAIIDLYESYYEVPKDAIYLIDTNYTLHPTNNELTPIDIASHTKMTSALSHGDTHIIICDADVIDFYAVDGFILELQHGLPDDILQALDNRLYECEGPVEDSDYYGINISDMEFTKQMDIQLKAPYICIPATLTEDNEETTYNFIRMILDLEQNAS